jgi:catechol 2,3-dioxygenase
VKARLTAIGAGHAETNEGIETRDPAGNLVKVVVG